MNPRLLSNNLVLPYLVSVIEDYFRSTFVSLLKYSTRKDNVFKNIRLTQDHLSKISSGELSVENAVAENLSFQNISSICQHFTLIDPKLDLAGSLKKPYRRRKKTLFETMEGIISSRHRFIHHGEIDIFLHDKDVEMIVDDLHEAIDRCYRTITSRYGWAYIRQWGAGRKRKKQKTITKALAAPVSTG